MNVYFARSIRGNRNNRDKLVNDSIIAAIKECGHTPTLETPSHISTGPFTATDRYIYLRDIAWIDNSQAMIAEVSNPSLGVGYELAYAKHVRNLPILCVANEDIKVSAMIAGSYLTVLRYQDLDHLKRTIVYFFEKLKVSSFQGGKP